MQQNYTRPWKTLQQRERDKGTSQPCYSYCQTLSRTHTYTPLSSVHEGKKTEFKHLNHISTWETQNVHFPLSKYNIYDSTVSNMQENVWKRLINECSIFFFFSRMLWLWNCTSQDESYRYIVKSHFYLAFSKDFNIAA